MKNLKEYGLLESFGDGTEVFTEKLVTSSREGKVANLDFINPGKGLYVSSGVGNIEFKMELEIRNFGLEDISFSVNSINVSVELERESENDTENPIEEVNFEIKNPSNVNIEMGRLPYFLDNLEIDCHGDINNKEGFTYTFYIGSQR